MTGSTLLLVSNLMVASLSAVLAAPLAPQQRPVQLEAADCSRIDMSFGEDAVGRAVQYTTVPFSVGELDVRPEANGGVRVERGAGTNYSITACVGAGAPTLAEAQAAADSVRIVTDGGRVRVQNGARVQNWNVHLIVEAPENARIRVETSNGPIGVSGVSGDVAVRAANGPIGLDDVSGRVIARTQNGPIRVTGGKGDFDVQADNGPISIALAGRRWEGRLDAHGQNGPLQIAVADDYQSGVEITSSGHSRWNCDVAACRAMGRTWTDDGRTLRIGRSPVVVRISTSNGPVTVRRR